MTIVFDIPIRTQCSLNSRMHWAKRAKLVKAERATARDITRDNLRGTSIFEVLVHAVTGKTTKVMRIPTSVKLTRKYSGVKPDDDGLRGYLKGVRDGIADAIGINDNDPRCQWLYDQKKAKRADFGVEVEVRYT